ncbi:hypothetical protein SAMN03097699_1110 [Flavobacteriaceae bacterium MAR_2010_188]|nr:hypothetical protein SAMN03097699_1110 [Flavobacteriaceae bacterium MAR_2010_188]
MAKIYSSTPHHKTNLFPKDETIDFLLSYSKALNILECNNMKFETLLN